MKSSTAVPISTENWLQMLLRSADELARVALGCDGARPLRGGVTGAEGLIGAYTSIYADSPMIDVGLASTAQGCQRLTKAFLGMSPDEPDLPLGYIADAMCEMSNIVVGQMKRQLHPLCGELRNGLPVFSTTELSPSDRTIVLPTMLGHVYALLFLTHPS